MRIGNLPKRRRWGRALLLSGMLAAVSPAEVSVAACEPFDHAHRAWTALLARHVRDGTVAYAAWKREGTAALDAYLASLAAVPPDCFAAFSEPQQIAFLIDAYNAATVRLVLGEYPIASIRKIGLLPGAAFRKSFLALPAVGPGEVSLDDIEHETLRKRYREPRIHFALVCAARSCPPLRGEAFRAEALEAQLDDQGRAFLRDPRKNRYDAPARTLQLSEIFDWFAEDFVTAAGSVGAFVAPFLEDPAASAARDPATRIEFLPYDWSLNGR